MVRWKSRTTVDTPGDSAPVATTAGDVTRRGGPPTQIIPLKILLTVKCNIEGVIPDYNLYNRILD